jgi:hypothetical protein
MSFPIKLRIDGKAMDHRTRCLDAALRASVGRAFANSKKLLELRGSYVNICLHDPSFSWQGLAVDQGRRGSFEQRIADILRDVAYRQGILSSARDSEVAEVLPPNPSEPYDDMRGSPVLGAYWIDSYDGDKKRVVPITSKRPVPYENLFFDWRLIAERPYAEPVDPEVQELLQDLAEYHATPESPKGVIYLVPEGWRVIITDGLTDDKRYRKVGDFGARLFRLKFKAEKADPPFVWIAEAPPAEQCTAEVIPLPADHDGLAAKLKELTGRMVLDELRRGWPKQPGVTTQQYDEWLDKRVDKTIERLLQDNPHPDKLIRMRAPLGTWERHLWPGDEKREMFGWRGVAVLSPITEIRRVPKQAKKKTGPEGEGERGAEARGETSGAGGSKSLQGSAACEPGYTDHSALYPEQYLEDTDFILHCRAFLGEPALDLLGEDGLAFQADIDAIANQLGLQSCRYAGNFCLAAGQFIATRARELGEFAGMSEANITAAMKSSSEGNLGYVQFEPQSTRIIQDLKRLAKIMDGVLDLEQAILGLYKRVWNRLCGRWYEFPNQWHFALGVIFKPIKVEAIGNLFIATCRVLLLQLLEASRSQIQARKTNIKSYAPVFEFLFRAYFTKKGELQTLKGRLQSRMQGLSATAPMGSWLALSTSLIEDFRKGQDVAKDGLRVQDDFVFNGDELVGIQDEHDNIWTKDALDQALTQREFLVESIDPLIKQFSSSEAEFVLDLLNRKTVYYSLIGAQNLKGGDLEASLIRRLIDEREITAERVVQSILDELLDKNGDIFVKALSSFTYAFETAPLHEHSSKSPRPIPYLNFDLQGIHKLADEQIGDSFVLAPNWYGRALNDLLSAEAGKAELLFAGLTLLAVLCPPLGAVAGAVVAVRAYGKALEKKALFRSLIDPDLIMTRAEVEAELFAAELGLVLAFIPEVKPILRGAAKGIQVVTEEGVRGSARAVVQQVRRGLSLEGLTAAASALRQRFAAQVAEQLKDGLIEAMIKQLAVNEVMDLFLSNLLVDPVIERIQEEFRDYAQGARGPGLVTVLFASEPGPAEGSQGAR